jgi:23S rRNA (uracil-5-)-methyltransferase RumA
MKKKSVSNNASNDKKKSAIGLQRELGEELTVTIKKIGINGEGIAYDQQQVIFVEGAIPEEEATIKITKIEKNHAYAQVVSIDKPSSHRIQPPCTIYSECGACHLQHLQYEQQLMYKREIVKDAFKKYATVKELEIRKTLAQQEPWHYRNKAQLRVVFLGEKTQLGLYERESHHLVEMNNCLVQDKLINHVMSTVREGLDRFRIPIFSERKGKGDVKAIVIRVSQAKREVQLTIVSKHEHIKAIERLLEYIKEHLPMVSGIFQSIHTQNTPSVFGEKMKLLWGNEIIEEHLGGLRFHLSPRSFFQLNLAATEILYNCVRAAAKLKGRERVIDAYCGVGAIGLMLAPYAKEVRGMDIIPEAIADATYNARLNGIENAFFQCGRAEMVVPQWMEDGFVADCLVVDPPRTGCDPALLQTILRVKPKRVVYVSCNPSTLAKDCAQLISGGYRVKWVQPIDMFPQTSHVECVALIELT